MSTSAQVRAAWQAAVFDSSTITAITERVYDFPITLASEYEVSKIYDDDRIINFIVFTVTRHQVAGVCGNLEQRFVVTVEYTKQQRPESANASDDYNDVIDTLETIDGLALSALSGSWSDTVGYWNHDERAPRIEAVTLDGIQCYRGTIQYLGFNNTQVP